MLLLSAGLDAHADHAMHPLGHRIGPAFDHLIDSVRLEDALAREHITLGGVVLNRAAVPTSSLPTATTIWTTPEGYAARLANSSESATSFENLLSCQLMWALRHVARLRPGRARSIPDQNRLMGNLAHALAREIFRPGPPPPGDAAAKNTEKILDGLIDMLAAPLRHPALAADLAFVRRRLPQAMAELANTLHANALTVEAAERQVSGTFEDALAVRGAIDLVARDVAGMPVIIDLKWTRSPRSRLDELKQGKAVQLATYGALLAGETPYRAGYFLLNQRQFATLASSGLIGRTVDGPRTFPETWSAIFYLADVARRRQRRHAARNRRRGSRRPFPGQPRARSRGALRLVRLCHPLSRTGAAMSGAPNDCLPTGFKSLAHGSINRDHVGTLCSHQGPGDLE